MTYYRFNNAQGEHFDMPFKDTEKARVFAYKFGYCFLGRTVEHQNGYFDKKSRENIRKLTEKNKE